MLDDDTATEEARLIAYYAARAAAGAAALPAPIFAIVPDTARVLHFYYYVCLSLEQTSMPVPSKQ